MGRQKGESNIKWVSDSRAQYILSGVFCFTKKYAYHIVMCILSHKKSACYLIFCKSVFKNELCDNIKHYLE